MLETLTGPFACAVILQIGGWKFRNGWLLKINSMFQNELKVFQLPETNVTPKNIKLKDQLNDDKK